MSVAYESAMTNEDEVSSSLQPNTQNIAKDSYEEELDYEEEVDDAKSGSNMKSEEDGELSDNSVEDGRTTKRFIERDEGELVDDEDLEEGEVKEEGELEEEANEKQFDETERNRKFSSQDERNTTRTDAGRNSKNYYNNANYSSTYSNQNYSNSRYNNYSRNDRYTSNRNRDYSSASQPTSSQPTSESAWERGLKQARELMAKASKRKEEEIDFDNKRFNLTVDPITNTYQEDPIKGGGRDARNKSPVIKRRRNSSPHSSSEDEVERRHRLAYDAAPWNNPNSSTYQSSNYRSRSNYPLNRSAETFRDPWRRSKSPKLPLNRNKRPDVADTRYGENYKLTEKSNPDSQRSNSMSSLSSIDSGSSNYSGSERSAGRKLPYSRPNLEIKRGYEGESELTLRNEYPKARMDRIPKKSNALSHFQSNERISETKSFDSWSESLSDSDSSSFFSDSDSDDSDASTHDKSNKISKKLKETSSKTKQNKKQEKLSKAANSSLHSKQFNKDSNLEPKGMLANVKIAKINSEKDANKKLPIKMTFMKTQPSLKKDRLIDEQLNGETFDLEDAEANNSRSSKLSSNKSQSDDEDTKNCQSKDSPSNPSSNTKIHRREELLLKLKAVEEAIERKLNSKKE